MNGFERSQAALVLGGARSGKSSFAEELVLATGLKPVYVATARVLDDEMRQRVEHHIERRDERWETIEEPLALVDVLRNEAIAGRALLVDCLTLWLTNLMMANANIDKEFESLARHLNAIKVPIVLVSNEVGQCVVPMDAMSREFVDHAGRLHQLLAGICGNVWFLTAGLPQQLK